jgi:Cu-processing system ATP-binding protein
MVSNCAAALRAIEQEEIQSIEAARRGVMICAEMLIKAYRGDPVLRDVSLRVGEGECLALLGHNGAGKTTLFKLMLGLIRPTGGRISVAGVEPGTRGFRAVKASLGFLPENIAFHDAMTGEEVLTFYGRLKGVAAEERGAALDRVGLGAAARQRIATYSKGMRQRLGLAQALMGSPRLLLLDEPTTGLDPTFRRDFFGMVDGLRRAGVTVIISTHALGEVEACADRVAILRRGLLVAQGTLQELRCQARLPVALHLSVVPGRAPDIVRLFEARYGVTVAGAASVSLACGERDKLALLGEIAALRDAVTDVDVAAPNLDDIYAFFNDREEPA